MIPKNLIERYFDIQEEVFKYFGYVQDWAVIPLDCQFGKHWMICGPEDRSSTSIVYSPEPFTNESVIDGNKIYSGTIYTQRHLPKWVYRGDNYTMICVDTHSDGNRVLMVFDNKLECKNDEMKELYNDNW